MLNSELITEVSKSNIVELASVAANKHKWNSEPDNNILLDEFPHLGLGEVVHGFYPLGEVIDGDHYELSLTRWQRKITKYVYSPLCEGS